MKTLMDIPKKMLYLNTPNKGPRLNVNNAKIDVAPLMNKLKDLQVMAMNYQKTTPRHVDFSPLMKKLKEAEAIGAQLQRKAGSGRL